MERKREEDRASTLPTFNGLLKLSFEFWNANYQRIRLSSVLQQHSVPLNSPNTFIAFVFRSQPLDSFDFLKRSFVIFNCVCSESLFKSLQLASHGYTVISTFWFELLNRRGKRSSFSGILEIFQLKVVDI